jgi:hypothetical protein
LTGGQEARIDRQALRENGFLVDLLTTFSDDLNRQLRPDIGFEATQVGGKVFCMHNRFRNRPQVATYLIRDGKFVAYVKIEPHGPPPSPNDYTTDPGRHFDIGQS